MTGARTRLWARAPWGSAAFGDVDHADPGVLQGFRNRRSRGLFTASHDDTVTISIDGLQVEPVNVSHRLNALPCRPETGGQAAHDDLEGPLLHFCFIRAGVRIILFGKIGKSEAGPDHQDDQQDKAWCFHDLPLLINVRLILHDGVPMNKSKGFTRVAPAAAVLLLAVGCARQDGDGGQSAERDAPEPAPSAPGVMVSVFDCADGERVVTRGREGERLVLHRAGESWEMEATDDAEGTYASDAGAAWKRDGAEAQWAGPESDPVRCGESPGAIVWEEARLRGVDYRAEAGDQSWELELTGDALRFRHRSRDDVLQLEDVSWDDDGIHLRGGDSEADVVLERLELPCDHGDGVGSLEQVRITVEGRPLQGCGGFLDDPSAPSTP